MLAVIPSQSARRCAWAAARGFSVARESPLLWPFYAYGLSDDRWSACTHIDARGGTRPGLAPEVWLINANDATLGALVLAAYVWRRRAVGERDATAALALLVVFRDATLLRETVEYLFLQHHAAGYPYTTAAAAAGYDEKGGDEEVVESGGAQKDGWCW